MQPIQISAAGTRMVGIGLTIGPGLANCLMRVTSIDDI